MNNEDCLIERVVKLVRSVRSPRLQEFLHRLNANPADVYVTFFKECEHALFAAQTEYSMWELKIEGLSLDFDTFTGFAQIRTPDRREDIHFRIWDIIDWVSPKKALLRMIMDKVIRVVPDKARASDMINKAPKRGYSNNQPDQNIRWRDEGP